MKLGTIEISNFILGQNQVGRIYLGSVIAWESITWVEDQSLLYDSTNIQAEFTTLANVDASSDTLKNTSIDITNIIASAGDGYFETETRIIKGDRLKVDDNYMIADEVEETGTVSNADPFGDSSGVALWQLDGDATDTGGNYDGTVNDGTFENGKYNQCLSNNVDFSRNDTCVLTNTGIPCVSATNAFSISFWVKLPLPSQVSYPSNSSLTIFSVGSGYNAGGNGNAKTEFNYDSRTPLSFGLRVIETIHDGQTGQIKNFINASDIRDDVWHHVVLSRNTQQFSMYLDNQLVGTVNNPDDFQQNNRNNITVLGRGAANYSSSVRSMGSMDQLRIFNRALTQEEVQKLYIEELYKVTTPTGTTPTTAYIAESRAISNVMNQDAGDSDFTGLVSSIESGSEFKMDAIFYNTSTDKSSADTLVSTNQIIDGDTILINENLDEIVASGVIEEDMVSSSDPFGDGSLKIKYLLDGDATDLFGNHNGVLHGNCSTETGKFNDCIKIGNGSNDFIGLENNIFYNDNMSISFWVNPSDLSSPRSFITRRGGNNDAYKGLSVSYRNDMLTISFDPGSSDMYTETQTTQLSTDTWHHIVMIVNTTDRKAQVYSDNVLVCDHNTNGENFDWDNADNTNTRGYWVLGNENNTVNAGLNGMMDQVEFYDKALTAEEVEILHYQRDAKYTLDTSSVTNGSVPEIAFNVGTKASFKFGGDFEEASIKSRDDVYSPDTISLVDPFGDNSGVALWSGDNTMNDTSGNYNCTNSGTPEYSNQCKYGTASFVSNKDNRFIVDPSLKDYLGTSLDTITMSGWLLEDGIGNILLFAGTVNPGSYNDRINMAADKTNLYFDFGNISDGGRHHIENPPIKLGEFNHYVFVVTPTRAIGYVNGEMIIDDTNSKIVNALNVTEIVIGATINSDTPATENSYVDQVRIFNRALTQTEVQGLYDEGLERVNTTYHLDNLVTSNPSPTLETKIRTTGEVTSISGTLIKLEE